MRKKTAAVATTNIQCVSVDSASFVIYPETKATEVSLSALKRYLCSFYFRIDNETGEIQRNTLYIFEKQKNPSNNCMGKTANNVQTQRTHEEEEMGAESTSTCYIYATYVKIAVPMAISTLNKIIILTCSSGNVQYHSS